jgi:hypothetical protein
MRRAILVMAALVLIIGANNCNDDESVPCDPDTCDGCCDAKAGCQSGTSASYCGPRGESCSACDDDEVCNDGKCQTAEIECPDGCIMPDTTACREPGTTDDACGPLGGECDDCTAQEEICDADQRRCTKRPDECDPDGTFSCLSQGFFCDDEGQCRRCPKGEYNCNGENGDECERGTVCNETEGCTDKITRWPEIKPIAGFNANRGLTQAEMRLSDTVPFVLLRVEDFHEDDTYPKTITFSSSTKRGIDEIACDVCVLVAHDCTGFESSPENYYNCRGKMFFAQAGTITVEQADLEPGGKLKASLADLKLVEWDEDNDEPVADGDCWEIQSAEFDVGW